MSTQTPAIDRLKEALAALDRQYHGTYRTPEAIYALMKTVRTFNITISDWNTLIDYINVVGLTLDALYAVVPELVSAIEGINAVDLTSDQSIGGEKTFTGSVKVPTPLDDGDAANKGYVDAKADAIASDLGKYLPLSGGEITGKITTNNDEIYQKVILGGGRLGVQDTDDGLVTYFDANYIERVGDKFYYPEYIENGGNLITNRWTGFDKYAKKTDLKEYVDKTQNIELPVQEGQWDGFIASILDPQQTPRIGFLTDEQVNIIKNYNIIQLTIPARVAPYLGLKGQHAFKMVKRDAFSGTLTDEHYIMFEIFHDDGVIISFGYRSDIHALYLNDKYDVATKEYVDSAKMISITYAALKTLRDNGQLIIGQQYRITDYECTTTKKNTSSAGHVFDIIVVADDVNVLNENARAILHDGDTYFADCNLETWQLKYCLDNDTARFAWADGSSGKGVIYWLKDEFGNECPYDFKNILFTSNGKYINAYTFTYTDNGLKDASIVGLSKSCYNNVIKEYHTSITLQLNWNIFRSTSATFNCHSNTFGNSCYYNTFGNNCQSNTFGNNCYYNTFGNNCQSNTFGNNCQSHTFGNNCYSNTFGNNCLFDTFGNSCYSNTFGDSCNYNRFGNSSTVINYCRNNIFDSDCSYICLSSEDTTASSSNYLQNVHIHLGVTGSSTSNSLSIVVSDRNLAYSIDYYASGSQDIILD